MTNKADLLYYRAPLGDIISYPEKINSVYVVEHDIWGGRDRAEEQREAKKKRQGNRTTIEEYLIDPVRSLLNDVFRKLSAPYNPDKKDDPVGQGYWIQAEFGSGKSHLLSFMGALALGEKSLWDIVAEKEAKAEKGKRESLYQFYNGISKKSKGDKKGILVVALTLVGQGTVQMGVTDKGKSLIEYIFDSVKKQFNDETGNTIALYPAELLSDWFLKKDLKLLGKDLQKFLMDPREFDDEEKWTLEEFLSRLQDKTNVDNIRDCGKRLWDYYEKRRGGVPQNIIPEDPEPLLKHMVEELMRNGYEGILLILDEMSLFMKDRSDAQRAGDEKTLVTLSNRLVHYHNLPIWTICTAQQRLESKMGEKNIIANERLKLVPLLSNEEDYYDIVLSRIRTIEDKSKIDSYWNDYINGFTWPEAVKKQKFHRFFPFHPDAIDVMKQITYQLTTLRSGLYFLHQALKTQTSRKSDELITMWSIFDDLVHYEEDPSGTSKAISNIITKFNDEWKAFEIGRRRIDSATKGHLKVNRNRCEKILKTLFLYHIAKMAPQGLSSEDIMNCVMEWKDHDKGQKANVLDNLDHYEILLDKIEQEIGQVEKVNNRFRFNPIGGGVDPNEVFSRKRSEAENSEVSIVKAWEHLLGLKPWNIKTGLATLDLCSISSIFSEIAPTGDKDIRVLWHNREIQGKIYMRDFFKIQHLPSLKTSDSGNDFFVFISSVPSSDEHKRRTDISRDSRVVFWSPDELTGTERELLIDFAAYRGMVSEYQGKDTDEAQEMIKWVQNKIRGEMGTIYNIVLSRYSRGAMDSFGHSKLDFNCQGNLENILTPVIARILDSVYESRDMDFSDTPAPFNDQEAMKVVNGIVRSGKFDKNMKKDKNYSASQNYGFALGIMKKPNDKKLDFSGNRFIGAIKQWITDKLDSYTLRMPVETIYKNFSGIEAYDGKSYGLSGRMIQIFLLCLVQEGRIKIELKGKGAFVDFITCANISDMEFKTATLDSMEYIHRVKAPEGWEILSPFAQVLLKEDFSGIRQEADIQRELMRLLEYMDKEKQSFQNLSYIVNGLFEYILMENPFRTRMDEWMNFLSSSSDADRDDPIPILRHALEKSFGYKVYTEDKIREDYISDFKLRLIEVENLNTFSAKGEKIKTAFNYSRAVIPGEETFSRLSGEVKELGQRIKKIGDCIDNETKLESELLNKAGEVQEKYSSFFLQAYGQVVKYAGEAVDKMEEIRAGNAFRALEAVYTIQQLSGNISDVEDGLTVIRESIFNCPLSHGEIEEKLKKSPEISDCDMTLENAKNLIVRADEAPDKAMSLLRNKIGEKAGLLMSGALRKNLEQGKKEHFIGELLKCPDADSLTDFLIEKIGGRPSLADEIKRYLRRIVVKKLKISDFKPSRNTIEKDDVNGIVSEFRTFLESRLKTDSGDDLPVIELE